MSWLTGKPALGTACFFEHSEHAIVRHDLLLAQVVQTRRAQVLAARQHVRLVEAVAAPRTLEQLDDLLLAVEHLRVRLHLNLLD